MLNNNFTINNNQEELLLKSPLTINPTTYQLFIEAYKTLGIQKILTSLFIHRGTIKRWITNQKVPNNYFNDLNRLLNNKYPPKNSYREQDQFYTTSHIAKYCYNKTLEVLNNLKINTNDYTFIEPSAGCCNFYNILPKNKRIGIDIEPISDYKHELIQSNYLDFSPPLNNKYIVIGNPPFGLRGNLALRFINHSYNFADIVAFILPPLFNSTGKGVPMKRITGYKLAHTENLPLNSFEYPNGAPVDIATIFQIWTKINTENIQIKKLKSCKNFIKIFSLSDGGTPSSTRNKKMLEKCDAYLPSTCFKGMQAYKKFQDLPNLRGYGVVFLKNHQTLNNLFFNTIDWTKIAFLSTNSAINLRTDLIENAIINLGIHDE
jgi:hypothetical protein